MVNKSWTEKHRPQTWSDIQGNNSHLRTIKDWAESWTEGDKAILLNGPPGVGKTTTAQVASKTLGYPISGINASSARKTDDVKQIAQQAAVKPTEAEHQLVLIDEIDGWRQGRGGPDKKPLYNVLDSPPNPTILTCNEKYDVPNGITSRVNVYDFKLSKTSRKSKLKEIAAAEEVDIDSTDLTKLAERPDLRSAINDLQRWAEQDVPPTADERQWETNGFDVTRDILKGNTDSGFGVTPDDLVMWLDQNVRSQYRGVEAVVAYDCIRRADKYIGYARDTRNYSYWRYATALLEHVARVQLTEPYSGYMNISFPEWFRSRTASVDDGSAESAVYKKLKKYDEGTFQFGGGYTYFRHVLLPMIRKMPVEDRKEVAISNGLERDEVSALGLTPSQFDSWNDDEVPEERQVTAIEINQSSALDW
jgi:replication factor C large subunit